MYTTFCNDFFGMTDNIFGRHFTRFNQPTVIVLSEERIKEMERKNQERTLKSIDTKIEELQAYRKSVEDSLPAIEHTKS